MLDVTDATFNDEVVAASNTVPVVVDLWAEWCGPCRTLGPVLEKVIEETGGRVKGVKVDVDANPSVSQAFQVQSIPAVYALKDGKIVDAFLGAQPEGAVREFVARLLPTVEEDANAELVSKGDETSLRQVLESDPDNADAVSALAALLVDDGRPEEALEVLARIPETAETRRIAALARTGGLDSGGDVEGELETLLASVKTDDDARQRFVDLLEVMGQDDPRTAGWRRRLASALF
jgi:putative thioredoxin